MESAAELLEAARAEFAGADVLLMAAAVADFRPAAALDDKIAKSGRDGLALELEPTADVLADLAGRPRAGPDARGLRRRARRGAPWSAAGPSWSARASTPWW